MLAHVNWPVIAKGNPMKGKGKTHRWRVLSGSLPNHDFVQQGVSIKDATFPGGLAPITVSRKDSLPKAPPKQQPKQRQRHNERAPTAFFQQFGRPPI